MISRRHVMASGLAFGLGLPALARSAAAQAAPAQPVVHFPPEWLPTDVAVQPGAPSGFIQVDTMNLWLYLTLQSGLARRYKIAVGAAGRNFRGRARVARKAEWPSWTPTANMIRAEPEIYRQFAGGLPGGHEMNPMGARALYLYQGNRDTLYRIHGTPQPWTIGQSFGSGCVRMLNDHAIDLYDRVALGAEVLII